MADRPRDPGPEGPDFDWLYGRKQQARPEATRAIPVQQRPASPYRPVDPPQPPTRPPARPPAPAGPERPRGRRLRARTVRRVVLLLLVAWIAYLVLVPVFAWNSVKKVPFEPGGARPADQPGTTYLLVGSDSRAGLTAEQRRKLSTGNAAGQRTDTIMLLHTGDGPNLLMSIPRDSLVEVPGHGTTKINAAFAFGGPKLLVRTLERATGIRIDRYAEIGLGGVVSIVDAVGGITICPERRMKDPLAGLDIKKGCQEADGTVALGYARSRHTDPQYGDITRAKHQREVVGAVGDEVKSPWSVVNPVRYWRLAHAAPESFAFGEGASPLQAVSWALAMTRTSGSAGMTCGVPIRDLAVHWDEKRSQQMFDLVKTDRTQDLPEGLCTPTGLPKSVTG